MLALVISLLGIELLLTSTAVAFSNEDSLIRLGFLPLMGIATYKIMIICANGQLESPIAHAVLGSGSVYRIIHYVAIVLLDRWSFEAKGPTSSLGGLEPASDMAREEFSWSLKDLEERIRFGIRVSTTTRFSTTKWSIKYVPQFDDNKPGLVPARSEFLWRTFIRVGSLGCCLGLLGTFAQNFWKHNASMFSQEYVPVYSRLQEVTLAELSIRIAGVLSYWVMQYLSLSLMYGFLSFLAVLVHLSDVEEWPPVFGPINETWSIARFWGRFYHQNIRRGCSSIAHFLTYSCLRLTTGGFFGRYVFVSFVFAISGIFHLLSDMARGISREESKAITFFLMQPLGMLFEQAVQILYDWLAFSGPVSVRAKDSPTRLGRVIGHGWVLFWVVWTSPVWIYTSLQQQ